MYIMLNSISKTVAYATQLVPQLSNVNLHNYIHVAEYPNEHNIRYAEIRELYPNMIWYPPDQTNNLKAKTTATI